MRLKGTQGSIREGSSQNQRRRCNYHSQDPPSSFAKSRISDRDPEKVNRTNGFGTIDQAAVGPMQETKMLGTNSPPTPTSTA